MKDIGRIVAFDAFSEIVDFVKGGGRVQFDGYHHNVDEYNGELHLCVDTFDSCFYEHDFQGMTTEPFDQDAPPDMVEVVFTDKNCDPSMFIGYEYTE